MNLLIKKPYAKMGNAPQRIVIDFVCMVVNIDEHITLIEALQGKNRM
jgi:hypothetical protein